MPTPINHLVMAQEILARGELDPSARRMLQVEFGAFLLGHTAADVQTVSGQPRRETHFYSIPPTNAVPAHRIFLETNPDLVDAGQLDQDHAAFVAGYLAHLLADETWWREVFHPFFGLEVAWCTWDERRFLHNVLRTHLDRNDQAQLGSRTGRMLEGVEPRGWLSFVNDDALRRWRDLLVEQLRPGHRVLTAEVFAARMHVGVKEVETALLSPNTMAHLYEHIPLERLQEYRQRVAASSVALVNEYLAVRG